MTWFASWPVSHKHRYIYQDGGVLALLLLVRVFPVGCFSAWVAWTFSCMVLVPRLRGRLPRCAVLVPCLVFRSSIITKMSRIRLGERGLYGSFTLCTVSPQQRPFPAVVLFPNLPTGSPGEQLQSPSLRSRPRSPSPSVYVHCVYTRHHLVRMPSDLPRGRGYKYHALPFAQPASLKSRERAREREVWSRSITER